MVTKVTDFVLTLPYFFSKTVVHGQNGAINLIITAFILYHSGVVQGWYKRYKIVWRVGSLHCGLRHDERKGCALPNGF